MKKTLIALSVLAMAGSVNAATVYDADGVTAGVFGDLEVGYKQAIGTNQDGALFVGDYDFGFDASTAVNDDVKVFGKIQWNGNETSDDDASQTESTNSPIIDNAYIGVTAGDVTVTVGRAVNFVDEIGVANDENIAGNYEANDAIGIDDKTSQVAKVMWDNGEMFYAGLAYTADADGDDTTSNDYEQIDLKAGLRVADLDVMVIYSTAEDEAAADYDNLAIQANYSIDALSLGALYTSGEKDAAGTTSDIEADAISLSVAYTMDKTTVGAGWSTIDVEGVQDQDQWYANVSYALATNASVYVEIAETEGDAGSYANNDMGYAVGAKLSF
ncbi:porin [Vibrio sp. JC009]|uniref:porin n=1 Tax=Vibrio sp. JC009 TaxID=2912314 RepID=UPI0023B1F44C|nr:porin [Vibrio sp. JC009]WED22732.1 porin [Vibrio sp. JC009]